MVVWSLKESTSVVFTALMDVTLNIRCVDFVGQC